MDSSFQTLDDFYVWKVSLKYLSQTYTALKYLQSPKTWYLKMSCYFDLCVQQKTQGFLKKAYKPSKTGETGFSLEKNHSVFCFSGEMQQKLQEFIDLIDPESARD